jgi:hypothetical protein
MDVVDDENCFDAFFPGTAMFYLKCIIIVIIITRELRIFGVFPAFP